MPKAEHVAYRNRLLEGCVGVGRSIILTVWVDGIFDYPLYPPICETVPDPLHPSTVGSGIFAIAHITLEPQAQRRATQKMATERWSLS